MNSKLSTLFVLFCHPLLKQTFKGSFCSQPTEITMATALFLYVSVYMCHLAWVLIYPSAGLSASVFGDFRGCLATWIYGSGGWGGYQKPCGSWRRDWRDGEHVCVCVKLQLIRSTSCSQAEFISTVCSFFTGIIHSHFSSWSFTIQFNVRLLHSIFRLVLNLQLFKVWAQWQCAQGLWRWLYIYYVLSGEKQDTVTGVWEERERERERESANSPRLSALLTDELHVAKRVCVCVCVCVCVLNALLHPRRTIREWLKASENVWLNMSNVCSCGASRYGRMSFHGLLAGAVGHTLSVLSGFMGRILELKQTKCLTYSKYSMFITAERYHIDITHTCRGFIKSETTLQNGIF